MESRASQADAELLGRLLDDWEEARDRGVDLEVDDLCRPHPHLAGLLRRKIEAIRKIEGRMDQSPLLVAPDADPRKWAPTEVKVEVGCRELEPYAAGGLGVVFRGRDTHNRRRLAVKFMNPVAARDEAKKKQFLDEARMTARLEHPGIVPVVGVGETDDGIPYYVMRFVRGENLSEAIDRFFASRGSDPRYFESLEFRDLLSRFVSICKTIAFAHDHGVVHRDLKPHNVILGRFGETVVIDWGLAVYTGFDTEDGPDAETSLVDSAIQKIQPLSVREGTLAYMSPEQHVGVGLVTRRVDVYALGVTLYKLVTGALPVEAETVEEFRRKVIQGLMIPAGQARPDCPPALAAICAKAMAVAPDERYESPLRLAADVEAYLSGHPSSVYVPPLSQRVLDWLVRHRFVAYAAAIGGLVSAAVATGLIVWGLGR